VLDQEEEENVKSTSSMEQEMMEKEYGKVDFHLQAQSNL